MTVDNAPYRTKVHLRWADIDANFHLRHSVFYDLCAQHRMEVLQHLGLTMNVMQELGFGLIIFREECTFRREIKLVDEVYLDVVVRYLTKDLRKFSFVQQFTKTDGTLCATLVVEGAWMDASTRKITAPPLLATDVFEHLPRAADFAWLD